MDYSTMFRMYDVATPDASTPTNLGAQQKGFNDLIADPSLQTAAFQIAAALDPEGFGGRLAKAGLAMRQAKSLSQGMTKAQQTQPTPQQQVPTTGTNPVDKGAQLTKLGSMLKTAAGMNPGDVPQGFDKDFASALSMDPGGVQNPTQPATGNAGQVAGLAIEPAPVLELDPSLAMSLTPEQVQNVFQHQIAKGTYDLARQEQARLGAKTAWDMDPQRVEEDIRKSVAPVLAQLDVYKGKQQFDVANAQDFLTKNPKIGAIKLPGGLTVGDQLLMDAASPGGAKNATGLIMAGIDMEIAKMKVSAELQATRIHANASGQASQFAKEMALVEKFNADIIKFEKGIPAAEWEGLTQEQRNVKLLLGQVPQTPNMLEARNTAIKLRDQIMKKWAPSYDNLIKAEDKAAVEMNKPPKADQTKLDALIKEEKSKPRGSSRSFGHASNIFDMFNPQGGMY